MWTEHVNGCILQTYCEYLPPFVLLNGTMTSLIVWLTKNMSIRLLNTTETACCEPYFQHNTGPYRLLYVLYDTATFTVLHGCLLMIVGIL